MRRQRSMEIATRAVLALLLGGCSPEKPAAVVEVPPSPLVPPGPPTEFRPPPRQIEQLAPPSELNQIRQTDLNQIGVSREAAFGPEPSPATAPRRLVFECPDGSTFAVRTRGDDTLELYPPNTPGGFLPLSAVPSASGMHYRIADIDFFSKGDIATLEVGRERYVDCVANPAASTWQEPEPRTGPIR